MLGHEQIFGTVQHMGSSGVAYIYKYHMCMWREGQKPLK